ncbi:hypothetical protein C8R45DRAFT_1108255 [Mycena sanguinolenta]|nr:hypothetical protein C8R45DRAFT_1108255 [Mycena sanguinolenta]
MRRSAIPSEAVMDWWMRAAPWIEFLDEYREYLFGLETFPPSTLYAMFIRFLRCMRENGRNDQVGRLMDTSLGVCIVVARAWHHLVNAEDDKDGLLNVAYFLVHRRESNEGWDTASLHALLAGAGGPTGMSFASFLVSHFRRLVPRSDSTIASDTPSLLYAATSLLCFKGAVEGADAFDDALLSLGFGTTLTTVAQALRHGPAGTAHPILNMLVFVLMFYLSASSQNTGRQITDSSRAGLLPAIIFKTTFPGEVPDPFLDSLLRTILPASTAHHSVLSQLRISLRPVSQHDAIQAFTQGGLIKIWRGFLALVESRGRLLNTFNAEGRCTIDVLLPDRADQSLYDFQRVADHGGRIQLHLMKVAEGKKPRIWFFAQWSSPEFIGGLKAIAETFPPELSRADLEKCLPGIRNLPLDTSN